MLVLSQIISSHSAALNREFLENAVLLNPDNAEPVILGTRQWLAGFDSSRGMDIAGTNVRFNDWLKLLCVTLDATLSSVKHVSNVVSYSSAVSHQAVAYRRDHQGCYSYTPFTR